MTKELLEWYSIPLRKLGFTSSAFSVSLVEKNCLLDIENLKNYPNNNQ